MEIRKNTKNKWEFKECINSIIDQPEDRINDPEDSNFGIIYSTDNKMKNNEKEQKKDYVMYGTSKNPILKLLLILEKWGTMIQFI